VNRLGLSSKSVSVASVLSLKASTQSLIQYVCNLEPTDISSASGYICLDILTATSWSP